MFFRDLGYFRALGDFRVFGELGDFRVEGFRVLRDLRVFFGLFWDWRLWGNRVFGCLA